MSFLEPHCGVAAVAQSHRSITACTGKAKDAHEGRTAGCWAGKNRMRLNLPPSWPVVSGRARWWGYQLPGMLCLPLKCVAEQAGKYCGAGGGLLLLLKLFYFTEVPQSMLKPMCFPFPESALNPSLKS